MYYTARILLLVLVINTFNQKISAQKPPDFNRLKKDVLAAQTKKEKAEAMMEMGGAISPRQYDLIFSYADSILLLKETGDEAFYENASIYLKATGFYKKGELDIAKKNFKRASNYFESTDNEVFLKALNLIGVIHLRSNEPDSAVITFNRIIQNTDNPQAQLRAYGNIGNAYRRLGNYEKAINSFEMCLNLDSTNQFSVLNSYLNIGSMYADMELYNDGIEIMKKVDISGIPPQPILAAYFNNLGELYFNNENYDSAINYLNRGFELALSLNQMQLTFKNRLMLSDIYLNTNHKEKAKILLKSIKNDLKPNTLPTILVDFNLKNSSYFLQDSQYDSAVTYAKRALAITKWSRLEHQAKNVNELIAKAFEGKGDSDSSAFYYKQHADFLDKIAATGKERSAQNAKARFLLSQSERARDESLNESNKLKNWQELLIGLLALSGLIVIYLYVRFKKSQSTAVEQITQNDELTKEIKKNKNEIVELKSRAILPINDIISIKADGHYLEFNLMSKSNPEVDRNQIKSILISLPSKFVQIHRSYVVNVDHIKIKQATKVILKDGTELPVSRTYKDQLTQAIDIIK